MKTNFFYLLPLLCCIALSGCQSSSTVDDILAGRKIDYQQIQTEPQELQYPPDLIAGETSVEGTVSLSEYAIRALPVLEEDEDNQSFSSAVVSYRRDGQARWIVANRPPTELWQQIINFWKDELGFPIKQENKKIGVIETNWLDLNRGKITPPGGLQLWDDFLGVLRDSGNRDKFITRLERNNDNETDIYISHRQIIGKFAEDTGAFIGYESAHSLVEVEIEMMRRLMNYLTQQNAETEQLDEAIDQQIAEQESATTSTYEVADTELLIRKNFYESWRLVQIALDRGGFTIDDRDYDNGIIYIQHSGGPESDQIFGEKKTGIFAKIFNLDSEPVLRNIKLNLKTTNDLTRITTEATEDNEPLTETQQSIVLNLLYDNLP